MAYSFQVERSYSTQAVLEVHLTRGAILPDHIVASSGLKCELLVGGGRREEGGGR